MTEQGTGLCVQCQGRTAVCMWVGDRAFPHTSQPPIDSDPINQPQLTTHSLSCLPHTSPPPLLPALPGTWHVLTVASTDVWAAALRPLSDMIRSPLVWTLVAERCR